MPHFPPLSYCAALVRSADYDRYLCTLFAPAQVREAWTVLFAWDAELAGIANKVSEEMLGLIRFAWWREALDEIYTGAKVREHPVAQALAEVIRIHALPRAAFDRMLAARTADVQSEPFATFDEIEAYCRDTSSALLELCALVAGAPVTAALDELGIAWALIDSVRKSQSDGRHTEFLIAAGEHLQAAQSDGLFAAFYIVCQFHLRRLRAGKKTKNPLLLTLKLWWKSYFL